MRFVFLLGGFLFVGAALVFSLTPGVPRPISEVLAEEKGAGLPDFMEVVHGSRGLMGQIRDSLGGGGPGDDDKAWKAVRARAAILLFLTDTILLKSQPSKGDKASWKEKVTDYEHSAKALARAAADKDTSAAKSEVNKMSKSCYACHKAHR